MKNSGYTLIELVVTIALLVIVLVGGTSIFYRSFRSSGVSDIQATLNSSLNTLDEMIEDVLKYGTVTQVATSEENYNRDSCLAAGDVGVSGDNLTVHDSLGGSATYSLSDGVVSSNTGEIVSNAGIIVTKLRFTWYCRSGVNDKINLLIEASSSAKTGEGVIGVLNKDINLLNSGIN
jgi:prepilin-type N-terminal cleavage/methylation domain-containing protein